MPAKTKGTADLTELKATFRKIAEWQAMPHGPDKGPALEECVERLFTLCAANVPVPTAAFEELGPDGRGMATISLAFFISMVRVIHPSQPPGVKMMVVSTDFVEKDDG